MKLTARLQNRKNGDLQFTLVLSAQYASVALPKSPSISTAVVAEMCRRELVAALAEAPIEWLEDEQ